MKGREISFFGIRIAFLLKYALPLVIGRGRVMNTIQTGTSEDREVISCFGSWAISRVNELMRSSRLLFLSEQCQHRQVCTHIGRKRFTVCMPIGVPIGSMP